MRPLHDQDGGTGNDFLSKIIEKGKRNRLKGPGISFEAEKGGQRMLYQNAWLFLDRGLVGA